MYTKLRVFLFSDIPQDAEASLATENLSSRKQDPKSSFFDSSEDELEAEKELQKQKKKELSLKQNSVEEKKHLEEFYDIEDFDSDVEMKEESKLKGVDIDEQSQTAKTDIKRTPSAMYQQEEDNWDSSDEES